MGLPGWIWTDRRRKDPTATEYVLLALAAVLLGITAVPERTVDPSELAGRALAQQTRDEADRFRLALRSYGFDHNQPAGYEHGIPGVRKRGALSYDALRDQLMQASDRRGDTGPVGFSRWTLGPYLPDGVPVNPVNDMKTVRFLTAEQPFPPDADGATGWIYKASSGELRPNALGTIPGSEVRFYDL